MKAKAIQFLLWVLTAFLALFALPFFPSFASLLFLLSALFVAPIPKVQNFLRGRGLRNGVRALLTAVVFIAGLLSAPTRPASDTTNPSQDEALESVSDIGARKTSNKTNVEPSAKQQEQGQEASAESVSESVAPFWDIAFMGNHPNVLLSGGKLYCRDNLTVLPEEDFTAYIVTGDSGESLKINCPMSYINVWDSKIIYRDDASRHIRAYDMETQTDTELLNVNAGEILVSEGQIFFSDLGQGASLFRASLDGGDAINVVLRSTGSFVVSGNQIFYLGNDQTLYSCVLSPSGSISGTPEVLAYPVECFFLDDTGLLAESGNTIFHISPDGMDASKVYSSENDAMRLVGVYDETIFYQEDGNLYVLGNEPPPVVSTPYLYYASPVINDSESIIVVAYDKALDDTGKVRPHLLQQPFGK